MADASISERTDSYYLRVSRYDRVSSLLISLLILIGLAVLVLLIAFLTSQIFVPAAPVPVELSDYEGDDGPVGGGQTPEPPNPEEIREMEVEEPVILETLESITSVVQKQVPKFDDPMIAHKKTSGMGWGHGEGRGRGDGVGDGSGGSSRGWQVQFDRTTLEAYARQLDFFGIELGVLLSDGRLAYVSNLSNTRPTVKYNNNPSETEKRTYLSWSRGQWELKQADRELLAKAGIPVDNRSIILKFLPPKVVERLSSLELSHAGRERKDIRRTRFGVRTEGNGYAFFVIDQSYKR
ncbi:MAG: hypothetical protein JW959_10125 [Pirellulales bacterium]|nr:hypothetical protein [Pirellulales bacterium]